MMNMYTGGLRKKISKKWYTFGRDPSNNNFYFIKKNGDKFLGKNWTGVKFLG